ncbi:hypothetical protein Leryth_022896 [Lithospermum erythrorhizon]|uniref:F-box protein n=1 Tax=Lithospermum erythrorhizon TaxID=34254 RepID=A0AAV3QTU0_LITER|nr:hypothetical protein Leryth_022896 [Lithospermum erythrorhizon]
MKRKKTSLTDLSYDVLSHIMHCVASSSGGASNILILSSVCRVFKDLSNDTNILKDVKFHGIRLLGLRVSPWHLNGLLFKCMQSGNHSAFECVFEYVDSLSGSYKYHKMKLFRWTVIRLARIRAVDIVNTRSRRKDLDEAIEEYQKAYDAMDIDMRKLKELLGMLKAVINL